MVHELQHDDYTTPAYAGRFSREPIPKNRMPDAESRMFVCAR